MSAKIRNFAYNQANINAFFNKQTSMKRLRHIFVAAAIAFGGACAVAAPFEAPGAVTEMAVATDNPTVRVNGTHVEINVPGDDARQVVIYTLSGQQIKTLTAHPGNNSVELPAGYYIVRCGRISQRVIVR